MQDTGLGPQPGGKTQNPGFSLSLAFELWDSKRGKVTSLFLPELCLQRYLYPMDMKGGHTPASWVLWTGYPPYPSHPSLLGPWAQLWPGKGEAMKEEDHAFLCLLMSLSSIHPKY